MKLLDSIVGLLMFSGIGLAAEGAQAEAQECCSPTKDCVGGLFNAFVCTVGYPLAP